MPTITTHTLNGRVAGYTLPSSRLDVLPDALGSAVRTYANGGISGSIARFLGYGNLAWEVAGYMVPRNRWAGGWGYRTTNLRHAEQYVRARHLSTTEARWTTVDPLWPGQSAYGYVGGNPTTGMDPSGYSAIKVHLNAFIDRRISTQYGLGGRWIPEAPFSLGSYYTNTSERTGYQSLGTTHDKVYGRASLNSCSLGCAHDSSFASWARTGFTYRLDKETRRIIGPRQAKPEGRLWTATVRGKCTFLRLEVHATYPFIAIAPAVWIDARISICRIAPGIVSMHGSVASSAFPDFDALYYDGKGWNQWHWEKAKGTHPGSLGGIGRPRPNYWTLPQVNIIDDCPDDEEAE